MRHDAQDPSGRSYQHESVPGFCESYPCCWEPAKPIRRRSTCGTVYHHIPPGPKTAHSLPPSPHPLDPTAPNGEPPLLQGREAAGASSAPTSTAWDHDTNAANPLSALMQGLPHGTQIKRDRVTVTFHRPGLDLLGSWGEVLFQLPALTWKCRFHMRQQHLGF